MGARAEATAATRDGILAAATEQFLERWYDEVTLGAIAGEAGVTQQTVINHFGSKEGLLAVAVERIGPECHRRGDEEADPVERVVADYEYGGDATIRLLALEERVPVLRAFLETGRAGHRAWLEETFGARLPRGKARREVALAALISATDIYTWKLLRRDIRMSRADTVKAMRRLVDGALGAA
jgi:AcrR family transcriptional regulator